MGMPFRSNSRVFAWEDEEYIAIAVVAELADLWPKLFDIGCGSARFAVWVPTYGERVARWLPAADGSGAMAAALFCAIAHGMLPTKFVGNFLPHDLRVGNWLLHLLAAAIHATFLVRGKLCVLPQRHVLLALPEVCELGV